MFKKSLFVFIALQIPIAQKNIILLGNIFLKPYGYSYSINKVYGVFPFFLNFDKLTVYQNKMALVEGEFVRVDWRSLSSARLIIKDIGGETNYGQTINIIKQFNFFKKIKILQLGYSGKLFCVNFKNKKDLKKISIISLDKDYFEVSGELYDQKGLVNIKTLDKDYNIHIRYNKKDFRIVFRDFYFISDFKWKKGKLFYKNYVVETSLFKKFLTLKHKDFISQIDFKKSIGFVKYLKNKPVKFSYFTKNNQFNLLIKKHQGLKYDFNQSVGFVFFDKNRALFKNNIFKNIKIQIDEYQKFHDIKADGFVTLDGIPYFNISAKFMNQYDVQVDIDPKMMFFKTDYFDGSLSWNFKNAYLKTLNVEDAYLKHDTLIYPYIDHLELIQDKKSVLSLKNCNYSNFESLILNWQVHIDKYSAQIKADIKKDKFYNGFLSLNNIKTPYLEKTLDVHLKSKNNNFEIMVAILDQSIMKGQFNLDKQEGELNFHTKPQEWSVEDNEITGVLDGYVKILKNWRLKGQISIENGYFENVGLGLVLKHIKSKIDFNNDHVTFNLTADQCQGSGDFDIKTQKSLYQLDFKGYDAFQSDVVMMKISGHVEGVLYPFYAKGLINIDKGVVSINESPLTQSFEIMHINKIKAESVVPISCDLEIVADKTLALNAFGLKSIWEGKILASLKDGRLSTDGQLNALKGDFEILGRSMFLKEGHIKFDKKDSLNPKLYLLFERSVEDKMLNVSLKGRVKNLDRWTFSSTPAMSQEDVISYLLFSTNAQTLSYYQVARLAYFLATFSVAQKNSGFQKVVSAIDIKNIEDAQTDSSSQILSIGKEFKNTKIALERELAEPKTSIKLEHKLTPNLLGVISLLNQGEEFGMRDTLSLDVMLRYVKNY